jgi:hypothetical protein
LDQLILVGERSLRTAVHEFVQHYHHERNHQGMRNQLLFPIERTGASDGPMACRARLGGLLKYYDRPRSVSAASVRDRGRCRGHASVTASGRSLVGSAPLPETTAR